MTVPIADPVVDVALRDGSTLRVRAVTEADQPELRALLDRLSVESRRTFAIRWLDGCTVATKL